MSISVRAFALKANSAERLLFSSTIRVASLSKSENLGSEITEGLGLDDPPELPPPPLRRLYHGRSVTFGEFKLSLPPLVPAEGGGGVEELEGTSFVVEGGMDFLEDLLLKKNMGDLS